MKTIIAYFKNQDLVHEYMDEIESYSDNFRSKIKLTHRFIKTRRSHLKDVKKTLKLKTIENIKLVDDISLLDPNYMEIYSLKDRKNKINSPNILNKEKKGSLEYSVPDISIDLLKNVYAVGYSILIYNNKIGLSSSLYNEEVKHDPKKPLLQQITSYKNKTFNLNIKNIIDDKEDKIYIHLLSEHANNYYHWLYEILPKLIKINEIIKSSKEYKDKEFILLINKGLFPQILQTIDLCVDFKYKLREIELYDSIFCKNIIYCSDFWLSLDNTRFKPSVIDEFFVDRYAVALVKEQFKSFQSDKKPLKKVYLDRKKGPRSLINDSQIKQIIKKYDFEIVDTSALSFIEQIKLFSETSILIGPAGAAFSNILFMQEDTQAIIFSPNALATNFYVFQQMADVANINLLHILGKNTLESIHDNLEICPVDLENQIKKILDN